MVKACFAGATTVFVLAVSGDGDDDGRSTASLLSKSSRDLVAVHTRKTDVEENEFGLQNPGGVDG